MTWVGSPFTGLICFPPMAFSGPFRFGAVPMTDAVSLCSVGIVPISPWGRFGITCITTTPAPRSASAAHKYEACGFEGAKWA
jgi:hypothetical protein